MNQLKTRHIINGQLRKKAETFFQFEGAADNAYGMRYVQTLK